MPRPLFSHAAVFRERNITIRQDTITTTTTLTGGDELVHVASAGGGFTLTLPSLSVVGRGRELYIIKADNVNTVTVAAAGAEVIGFAGLASVGLTTIDSFLHLISDGAIGWYRV